MPVASIHVLLMYLPKVMDGRDKPGHDNLVGLAECRLSEARDAHRVSTALRAFATPRLLVEVRKPRLRFYRIGFLRLRDERLQKVRNETLGETGNKRPYPSFAVVLRGRWTVKI